MNPLGACPSGRGFDNEALFSYGLKVNLLFRNVSPPHAVLCKITALEDFSGIRHYLIDTHLNGEGDPMRISLRLSEFARRNRGWNLRRLADELNVDYQNVLNWKSGRACPHLSQVIQIARLLRCRIDQLLDTTDHQGGISEADNLSKAQAGTSSCDNLAGQQHQTALYHHVSKQHPTAPKKRGRPTKQQAAALAKKRFS